MKTSALALAAALAFGATNGLAATQPSSATASPAPATQVESGAVEALNRMSAYLRALPAFQITLQTERDDVDIYGQLITLSGEATYKVRRPDAFAIDLALPSRTRQYIYDGKTVAIFDPKTNYYAKFDAAPTIRATLQLASEKYGAELPLEDLFTWTEGDSQSKALTSAHYIGKAQIAGQTANHYAFRQPGVDWQIWIADGDKPLPLRVAIVASSDDARPKFEANLAWDTAPQFSPDTFVFAPPPNAKSIDIHPIQP
jgi:hypothetical protein